MIPVQVATLAVTRLLTADPFWLLRDRFPRHLLLALHAGTTIRQTAAQGLAPALTLALTSLLDRTTTHLEGDLKSLPEAVERLVPHLTGLFGPTWPAADLYRRWHRRAGHQLDTRPPYTAARSSATIHIALAGHDFDALRRHATDPHWTTREATVQAIATGWPDHPRHPALAARHRHRRRLGRAGCGARSDATGGRPTAFAAG